MYKSFLICEHEKIICFYAEGIEIGIFNKETKQFENKDKNKRLSDAQAAFFRASMILELSKN